MSEIVFKYSLETTFLFYKTDLDCSPISTGASVK